MRILSLTAALLFASTTAACVTDGDEGRSEETAEDWRSGGKGDGETCEFDAMSAATYYKQFAYEKIVSESGSTWYRVGLTWNVTAALDNGNKISMTTYFLPNDRVIAEYSEQQRIDGTQSEVLNQTVIVTRARIDATTRAITLDGVGSGTPLTLRNSSGGCQPAIAFKFAADIRSPGLKDDSTSISAGLSSGFVIDPDHLDDVPYESTRRYFQEDVASGKIKIVRF